jgi:hypothetical protein
MNIELKFENFILLHCRTVKSEKDRLDNVVS